MSTCTGLDALFFEGLERVNAGWFATLLIHNAGYTKQTAHSGALTLIQRLGSALNLNKQSQYPRCASYCVSSNRLY